MAYIAVEDFKFGLDRRRPRVAGVPGTLWTLTNAHLTRGGDIERAKKFSQVANLIPDTFGLHSHRNRLFVFGSVAPPVNKETGHKDVLYRQLSVPSGAAMVDVLDAKSFDDGIYVIADYDSGNLNHFYNGVRVSQWDTVADAGTTLDDLRRYLAAKINRDPAVTAVAAAPATIVVEAIVPGVDFTVAVEATNGGAVNDQTISAVTTIENVPAVAATRATGTLTISGDGYLTAVNVFEFNLLRAPVEIVNADDAARVAKSINDLTTVHGYSATSSGTTVTISAPAIDGDSVNGRTITVSKTDDVITATTDFAGGVFAVAPVAKRVRIEIGGTFEPLDKFTVTINGVPYVATGRAAGYGTSLLSHKSRMFSVAGKLLRYSKLNDATDWTDIAASSGAGFINLASESDGSQRVVVAIARRDQMAIFSDETIFLFNIGADAAQFASDYPVSNSGTIAPRSVVAYGNSDVFYIDRTGVRSLRARSTDGTAFTSDVGNAIDMHVVAFIRSLTDGSIDEARSVIEPESGRLWVAIRDRIYVFSHFPGSKISAWSVYELGFVIDELATINGRIYVRSGDALYLYGGRSGDEYPGRNEQVVTVEMPFMTAEKPATLKTLTGFDAVMENTWDATLLVDPDDETLEIDIGQLYRTTGSRPHISMPGRSAMAAVKMVCSAAGKATISSVALHFETEEQR